MDLRCHFPTIEVWYPALRRSLGAVCCEPSKVSPLFRKPLRWEYFPVRTTAREGPQIELVTQHNEAPSTFRDRYQSTESGFHHVALAFGDHDQQVKRFNELGYASVTSFKTAEGRGATYLDTVAAVGHATEIYIVNDSLIELYANVRNAAENWNGQHLIIDL